MRPRVRWMMALVVMGLLGGCAALEKEERTLRAPAGTPPAAMAAMEEGNRLFAAREWALATVQYAMAIKAQPSLAEAHYNLAAALEMLGDDAGARRHYIEAANLAPGHKVIWDSPPLRQHGMVESKDKGGTLVSPAMAPH
jgi:Flp pilus assembly protein TadD